MEASKDEELKQEKSVFAQNEMVLCYEPDPLKAKMLYEAKVLLTLRARNTYIYVFRGCCAFMF